MTIGKRLREMAEGKWGKRGAIKKLADELGIKMSNLYIYLKDESKPGADILLKLNSLGFDLNYLLKGKITDDPAELFNAVYEQNPYLKRIQQLEEENKKLKSKIAVYEKAEKYMAKARSS